MTNKNRSCGARAPRFSRCRMAGPRYFVSRKHALAWAMGAVLGWTAPVWAQGDEPWKAEIEALRREIRQAAEGKAVDSRFHLAGYASVDYVDPQTGNSSFTGVTFNPIFHYSYKDWLLLDAEIGTQLSSEGETETSLEYMTANLVLNDSMILVAGRFLSPIGMFRRNIHPSWVNKLPSAPIGFDHGQAVPLADVGLQLTGGIALGATRANYAIYTANGPMLELNAAGDEIEEIGTEGQGSDMNDDKVIGGRVGWLPLPRLEVGVSFATGKASGEGALGETGNRDYDVVDVDFSWQVAGFDLRGEYTKTELGEGPAAGIDPAEKEWTAWYTQAAYRLPGTNWEAVLRYGGYEPPTGVETRQWTPGINYLFAAHVIAKLAYEFNDTDGVEDDDRLLLQIAYGF